MNLKKPSLLLIAPMLLAGFHLHTADAFPLRQLSAASDQPVPEIFAPGIISSPANDGSPTFSPDGNTLYFTRSTANWTAILESHKVDGKWSKPLLATFSGEWPDSSPAMASDGSFLVFQSTRPTVPLAVAPKAGEPIPGVVSNLWRVDRIKSGPNPSWSQPVRLPDAVNLGPSIVSAILTASCLCLRGA